MSSRFIASLQDISNTTAIEASGHKASGSRRVILIHSLMTGLPTADVIPVRTRQTANGCIENIKTTDKQQCDTINLSVN
ncbi:MAG: hypothetical protein UHZ01_09405 [Prevotella sp.]|nr:hypothetical protein [Prevotella sp.]